MKELMFGLLRLQTEKTDDELQELLFEDVEGEERLKAGALDVLKGIDATRVSSLKLSDDDLKKLKGTEFDKGFQKAQGELMTGFEKELKSAYTFESNLQGQDLIKALITEKTKSNPDGSATLTDEDVKKHPLFINVTDTHQSELQKANEDWQGKLTALETAHAAKAMFGKVKDKAEHFWNTSKAVFPENATHAASTRSAILSEIDRSKYQEQEGKILVLNEEGNILENEHGHRVQFDDHIKEITAKYVGFQAVDQRSSSGGSDGSGGDGNEGAAKAWSGAVPKDDTEFMKQMTGLSDEDQILLNNAYMKSKAS